MSVQHPKGWRNPISPIVGCTAPYTAVRRKPIGRGRAGEAGCLPPWSPPGLNQTSSTLMVRQLLLTLAAELGLCPPGQRGARSSMRLAETAAYGAQKTCPKASRMILEIRRNTKRIDVRTVRASGNCHATPTDLQHWPMPDHVRSGQRGDTRRETGPARASAGPCVAHSFCLSELCTVLSVLTALQLCTFLLLLPPPQTTTSLARGVTTLTNVPTSI